MPPPLTPASLVLALSLMLVPRAAAAEPRGVWPLDPRPAVAEGFAPPAERWQSGHRGVDLLGSPGQVVRSALGGAVTFAGQVGGKPVVVVDHGGRRTTYEPVAALVTRGELVGPGDPLGRLVVVGSHCFPAACLHWGLREGETYLDPLRLVSGGPVRLLPVDPPVSAPAPPWSPPRSRFVRPLDALA
jgi:murein DD-endopeptidase MepM/ murein hydrolase activator NlpD